MPTFQMTLENPIPHTSILIYIMVETTSSSKIILFQLKIFKKYLNWRFSTNMCSLKRVEFCRDVES